MDALYPRKKGRIYRTIYKSLYIPQALHHWFILKEKMKFSMYLIIKIISSENKGWELMF